MSPHLRKELGTGGGGNWWEAVIGIGLILIGLAVDFERRAWLASERGGFPYLSWRTWEELRKYAIIAGVVIGARVVWICVLAAREKRARPPHQE